MHTRKEIIENQSTYKDEITKYLKSEFTELKKDILKIQSDDPEIIAGKNSLLEKSKKVKINEEISKLLITWKNINPTFYAWWDINSEQVVKFKYVEE